MNGPAGTRVADAVYDRLREMIFTGELEPDARLSVPALADALDVGRSPVRDAVLRLVRERLAHETPRRGAVVARVGAAELAAIYEVREMLEGLAARLAVENAGRRFVRTLHEVLEEHQRAVRVTDLEATTEADTRFHSLIREACGNSEVIRLLDEIQTQVRLGMRTTTVTAGPRHAVDDHRAILTAIESGDPHAAEHAARAHIYRLRALLQEQAAQGA